MGQRADELERGARESSGVSRDRDVVEEDLAESTAAALEEIELTRADMSSTIEAIQDRLDPEVLSEQAKDTAHDVTDHAIREAKEAARDITDHAMAQVREAVLDITGQAKSALREATIGRVETMAHTATETAGGWRQMLVETVKANPLPSAVVGLGLGWMFLNRSSQANNQSDGPTYGQRGYTSALDSAGVYGGSAFGSMPRARTGPGGLADNTQGLVERVTDQAQQTAGEVVDQVQVQASRAQSFLQHQLEENPLLVGAAAVAIGGVLAATVPVTPREDQLMGDARDRVMGTARELTQGTMHKVGRVVDEAQSAAKEEAQHQSLVPEASSKSSLVAQSL